MNRQSVVEPRFGGSHSSNRYSSELLARLEADEKLLWSGQSGSGLVLHAYDALLIPFSLFWCGGVITWESTALASKTPAAAVMGIPFVLIGIYIVFGRFVVDIWMRRRTVYAVTNQRVIILSGLWRRETRSLYLEGLTEITLSETANYGTLKFGRDIWPTNMVRGWPGSERSLAPVFESIDYPAKVLQIIRDAQRATK